MFHDSEQNKTITYTYDGRGNILSKSEYAYTTAADLSGLTPTSTVSYSYTNSAWTDELTAYNGNTITYDNLGNRTSYNGWTYTWEGGRLLSGMTNVDGTTITYKYNVDGIRTSKTVNGVTTTFTTIDGRITSQMDGTNFLYFWYNSDDELFGFEINDTNYIYVKNIQGDIIAIADTNGTIVVRYAYDAWGNVTSITGSLADTVGQLNPMRYRGYYLDAETGYYYLQSRYYEPEMERFINADEPDMLALGKTYGTNLFSYCINNPVNHSDPTGYWSMPTWTLALAIDSAVLALASNVHFTWCAFMAPLKFISKKGAAAFFADYVAPKILTMSNVFLNVAQKALIWIGKKALAATFNASMKGFLSLVTRAPIQYWTIVTSIGGFIAAILDFKTDGRPNGWIKVT